MKRIFIVGSINTDLVIAAPYMPKSGETLTGSDFFTAHGGKGANQAIAAARLGGNVSMCGCVGDDDFGKSAVQSLKESRVDVTRVKTLKNTATGTAVIVIIDGDNRIILDKGANARLSERDIDEFLSVANKGDIYLSQLENPIDVIGYGLKAAKEKGMIVVLNPAPAEAKIQKYLVYCDYLIPNETELEILGGKEKILKSVKCLIVTLGDKGFEITQNGLTQTFPCIKVKAVDTTAAGDTFCGGFCVKLAEGCDVREAALFGSLAASVACTKKGAQPSIPTFTELSQYR